MLGLVGLGPDEAGGVGGSEGPYGAGVGEEGVVHGLGDETVPEGLVEEGCLGEGEGGRDPEGY